MDFTAEVGGRPKKMTPKNLLGEMRIDVETGEHIYKIRKFLTIFSMNEIAEDEIRIKF